VTHSFDGIAGVANEGAGVPVSIVRRGLLALAVVVAGLLPAVAVHAVPRSITSVSIDPSSGPPGTTYTATIGIAGAASCTVESLEFAGVAQAYEETGRTESSIGVSSQVPADAPVGLQRVLITLQCPPDPVTCSPGTCAPTEPVQRGGSFEVTKTVPPPTSSSPPPTSSSPSSSSPPPSSSTPEVSTPTVIPQADESGGFGGRTALLVVLAALLLGAGAATLLRRNGRPQPAAHRVTVRVRPDHRPSASVRERPGGDPR